MPMGADMFNGLYANEDLRGTVTPFNGEPIACVSTGITDALLNSDLGQGSVYLGKLRILTSTYPVAGMKKGDIVSFAGSNEITYSVRMSSVRHESGMTSFDVETPETQTQ